MRRVSGDSRLRRRIRARIGLSAAVARSGDALAGGCGSGSAVAVAISDTIEGFDLGKILVDGLELLAQPLDVAVDGAIVDVDVLAIGAIHELIAALHMAGTQGQRLQDEEL